MLCKSDKPSIILLLHVLQSAFKGRPIATIRCSPPLPPLIAHHSSTLPTHQSSFQHYMLYSLPRPLNTCCAPPKPHAPASHGLPPLPPPPPLQGGQPGKPTWPSKSTTSTPSSRTCLVAWGHRQPVRLEAGWAGGVWVRDLGFYGFRRACGQLLIQTLRMHYFSVIHFNLQMSVLGRDPIHCQVWALEAISHIT